MNPESERRHPSIIGRDRKLRKRRPWIVPLVLLAIGVVLVPSVPTLLSTWDEPPRRAGAIYVFPGQVPERAECGAALFREGVAPRVVFSGESVDAALEAVGRPMDDATLNALVARNHGVPTDAQILLHAGSSTWEDAVALGDWMRRSGTTQVVAVTSPTHSRRAQYTLWAALGELGEGVHVYRCGTIYGPMWWTRERSLVRVTLEALKLGYYALRYLIPSALGLLPEPAPPKNAA